MEHIISINKLIFKNDPLSKEIKVHRTKCTSIITNVVAENIKYNISNEMKNKYIFRFSLMRALIQVQIKIYAFFLSIVTIATLRYSY